jgi:diguanylate cyclase (GGDEF)-like protein
MNLGKAKDFVCIVRDASQRRKNEAEIRHRAHHDSLTGLPNRALLNDRLNIAFDLARRENHALALLFLDLDHFKEINDGLGHEAGDEVLSEVAKRLLSVVRASDTVARLGGDEFVVLLPAMTSASHCETVCRKLLDSLQADLVVKGVPLRVTFSIGAAVFPDHAQDIDSLMRYADEAMYVAKRSGRNGYQLHAPQAAAQSASP